jgi:hypothetical protein
MSAARPNQLLVPSISELEWDAIRPSLEQWAEVATYDLPGRDGDAGAGSLTVEATVRSGIGVLEERGWSDAIVVGDQFGSGLAVLVASQWKGTVRGLALGHACLHYRREGPRPAISAAVADFQLQLSQVGPAAAQQMFVQAAGVSYGEAVVERIRERLSPAFVRDFSEFLLANQDIELESMLRALDVPLLLVEHRDCPLWTAEGFEDAVAAFPHARTVATTENPGSSPAFAEALREFALSL